MMPFIPNPADKSGGSHRDNHHFQRMIAQKERTAPQHTRSFCRRFTPTKSFACTAWAVFFFSGKLNLESFISRLNVIPAFQPTLLQNRGRNFVRRKRQPPYMSSTTSTYFCVLTIRKQLPEMCFERSGRGRSGRGQEPSRGHKFSILENVVFHWDFTSTPLASFDVILLG